MKFLTDAPRGLTAAGEPAKLDFARFYHDRSPLNLGRSGLWQAAAWGFAVVWPLTIPEDTVAQPHLHGFGPTHTYTSLDNGFTGYNYDGWLQRVGDVDGDGRDELITFYRDSQPGAGRGDVEVRRFPPAFPATWQGSLEFVQAHEFFCIADEIPATGDFDGDGDDDVVAFSRGTTADVSMALSNGRDAFVGTGVKWHEDSCSGQAIPVI